MDNQSFAISGSKIKGLEKQIKSYVPKLTPIGFRDTNFWFSPARSNTNQTGTSRVQLLPQLDCQDIVLAFPNSYVNNYIIVPNTNTLTVKASIEINGTMYPVYFNGKRTVIIDPGAIIFCDPINVMISTTDSVFVRVYTDAGASGYTPNLISYAAINGVQDGYIAGSDMTDSGTVTGVSSGQGYAPKLILGTVKNAKQSVLLVGDSIIDGTGDYNLSSKGNNGFAARRLFADKVGSNKVSVPGQTAPGFLSDASVVRNNYTTVICNYGRNDASQFTLAVMKTNLLKVWKYYASKGLAVYQTTITPKTTSTDLWVTLANQTLDAYETTKQSLNVWLRDTTSTGAVAQSGGNLVGILDVASTVEDVSGKWKVSSTPAFSGIVKSATANSFTDSSLPFASDDLDFNGVVKITGGTGAGQALFIKNNAYGATTVYTTVNWTTNPDTTSTYEIWKTPSQDGTHPNPDYAKLMATMVNI